MNNDLNELDISFEEIFYSKAMGDGRLPEGLRDALGDGEIDISIFEDSGLVENGAPETYWEEDIATALASRPPMLLIKVQTPIPRYSSSSSFGFSWGHTRFRWLIAPDFSSAERQAVAWRNALHEEAKAKNVNVSTP